MNRTREGRIEGLKDEKGGANGGTHLLKLGCCN